MLDYIHKFPNRFAEDFNPEIIEGMQDIPIEEFAIQAMRETEAIENIRIEKIQFVRDQSQIDLNLHSININFKKKNPDATPIPKVKRILPSRYSEIIFTIRITTNLNERVILKRLLIPAMDRHYYVNNGKRMRAIWQIVDASTYSQRGKLTMKGSMPTIIYQNKNRTFSDIEGTPHRMTSYSYALNSKGNKKKGYSSKASAKSSTRFINPLMIYFAKMGYTMTRDFFGMKNIIFIDDHYDENALQDNYVFQVNEIFIRVSKKLFDKYDLVRSFVCMICNAESKVFPITMECLEDREYWVSRIGTIGGTTRNKSLSAFFEKGTTTIYMIERLLDQITMNSLRIEEYYKQSIYHLMYWMMTNFQELRAYSNIDMRNKRIRRNEYIVAATLGKKINENIIRVIQKCGNSRMNTIETLLEIFNFRSDIIIAGMRNLNDVIKTDDIVNDMDMLLSLSYSNKGPNSLGESNGKMIAKKYRYLHPSMIGKVDLNVSPNSDVGMSGSFTPYTKLYDGFYFTEEHEPCKSRYYFDKSLHDDEHMDVGADTSSFDAYMNDMMGQNSFKKPLEYQRILIVEKPPT